MESRELEKSVPPIPPLFPTIDMNLTLLASKSSKSVEIPWNFGEELGGFLSAYRFVCRHAFVNGIFPHRTDLTEVAHFFEFCGFFHILFNQKQTWA